MESPWNAFAEYCNEDGARCYTTARKTNRQYTCQKCKLVHDLLVKRNNLCAVCFRSEVLATGQNFCIGKLCYDKHQAHLAIQKHKRTNGVPDLADPWSTSHVASSVVVCDAHPPAVQDPWGIHDGCSAQRVLTTSNTTPAGRTSTFEPGACMQLPAPAPLQRNHLSDEHLVATLDHLVQEVRSAKEELRRISDNLETLLSDARKQVRVSNSMEQTSNNSVQLVIPHLLRHQ